MSDAPFAEALPLVVLEDMAVNTQERRVPIFDATRHDGLPARLLTTIATVSSK